MQGSLACPWPKVIQDAEEYQSYDGLLGRQGEVRDLIDYRIHGWQRTRSRHVKVNPVGRKGSPPQ